MLIKTKYIDCASKSIFNKWKLPTSASDVDKDIYWSAIVFIKDTGEIWTHGKLYGGLFSNADNNKVSLAIGGTQKILALDGHVQSYNTLTGSGTIADQVILSTGESNKWTLKTLGKNAFSNENYLPLDATAIASEKVVHPITFKYNENNIYSFDGSESKILNFKQGDNVTITGDSQGNITISSDPGTNTVNTVGATNLINRKLFLIGAESQTASPKTYSNESVYIGTDNCLYSGEKKVLTDHQSIYGLDIQTLINSVTTKISSYDPKSSSNSFTLVQGTNVTLTPDVTNKRVTIASKDTTYSFFDLQFKNGTVLIDTYKPTTSPTKILTAGTNVSFTLTNGEVVIASVDTRNTTGTTNRPNVKMYLVGADIQEDESNTYSNNFTFIGTDNCLYSLGKKVLTEHQTIYNLDLQTQIGEAITKVTSFDPNAANNSFTLVQGNNITLTPDATNKKITISGGDTTYDFYNLVFKQGESVIDTYKPTTSPSKTLKAGTNVTFTGSNNEVLITTQDTRNTAGATEKLTTKLFLTGALTQTDNPQTYTNSKVYIGADNKLYSDDKVVSTGDHTHNYAGATSPGGPALKVDLNPSGLLDATYGSYGGILQDSNKGPVSDSWSNRIKILHNNSTGYYTELAQNFTGTAGLWHRRNVSGTISEWTPVIDNANFHTYLDSTYVIRGNDPNVLTNYVRYSIASGLTMNWEMGNTTPTHIWGTKANDSSKAYVFNGDNIRAFANAVNRAGDTMTGILKIQDGGGANNGLQTTVGNGLVMYNADTATYLAQQAGTTYIRSGATDLQHRYNGTDYKIWDARNDGSGSGLDADLLDGLQYNKLTYHNIYNYRNGLLVTTEIASNSDQMFIVKIIGNSFNADSKSVDTTVQFYNYNSANTILNYGATNNAHNFGNIKVFNYNGKVCFWFLPTGSYQTFSIYATTQNYTYNVVENVTNTAMPTTGVTREVTIIPKQSALVTDNVASATRLQTARTIAGVSFDGTINIAIPFSGLTNIPSTFTPSAHNHNYFIAEYIYPNNISPTTAAGTLSSGSKNTTAMMADVPVWSGFGTAFTFTGYDKYGSTQLVSKYNATNGDNRLAFRVFNQAIDGYNNFTEIWTKDNLTNLNQLTTRNFNDLQNKPTTLSGYGVTDSIARDDRRGGIIANNINYSVYGFGYLANGFPVDGSFISFGGLNNKYVTQIQGNYFGAGMYYRTRNDDNGTWNSWHTILDDVNAYTKTSADNTFLKLAGGTLTGELMISPNIGIRTNGNRYSIIYNDATTKNSYIGAQEATTYIRSGDTNLYHRRNGVADYTIWDSGNDGAGSGLDADLLDGYHYQNILERSYSGTSSSGTATGWFRIGIVAESNAAGQNFILTIKRGYNYADNEAYTFSISAAYSGSINITQLSGFANVRLIDKIRLDYTNSGNTYIDLHIASSTTNNTYRWTTIGGATSYTSWTSVSDTPTGTAYEFTTVNGVKSDRGFTGDIIGNASTATKVNTNLTFTGYSTGTFNGSTALSIAIPNNTSQLANDAGYVTSAHNHNYGSLSNLIVAGNEHNWVYAGFNGSMWLNYQDKDNRNSSSLISEYYMGNCRGGYANVHAATFYGSFSGNGAIPIGGIIMWSGSIDTIPSGWALCNGSNGTPDLSDRFVMGASIWLAPGNTGGSNTTYLTAKQLPSHSHAYTTTSDDENNGFTFTGDDGVSKYYNRYGNRLSKYQGNGSDGNNNSTVLYRTSYTGSGAAIENRPAYYALAFIMRIS